MTNLISNTGVSAADVTGVGAARQYPAGSNYGTDKAIFAYGEVTGGAGNISTSSLVSNVGVVASDTTGVGTARTQAAGASYGP